MKHVEKNVEQLCTDATKAKERVAAVIETQQEVALSRDEFVVAT